MTTEILRPNGNVTTQWYKQCSYTYVDNAVEQPSTSGDSDYSEANYANGDNNQVFTMTFSNLVNTYSEITNVRIWSRHNEIGLSNAPEVTISVDSGSSWESVQDLGYASIKTWTYKDFAGSWSQAEINNLYVKYIADVPSDEKIVSDTNDLYVSYVVITGTSSDIAEVMTVEYDNIDEIMTVSLGDIDEVMTVSN